MARSAVRVEVSEEERRQLERLARTPSAPNNLAQRARIVLRAAEGATNREIADELQVSLPTAGHWRATFVREGLEGLRDRPRPGRPRAIDEETVNRVLAKTLEPPPRGRSHWSVRDLAHAVGLAPTTVHRIWRDHRLRPHQTRTFKYSRDPELVAKVTEIVGLYLNPPDNALVLCVDEKTQIQALERTQPILPMRPGLPERRTHDYRRNGTVDLFAALQVSTGRVVGQLRRRHRHQEFIDFLRRLDREFPQRELHLILDNSSTHSTPEVKRWLERHPRFHLHFTPKGASWMNLIESWFSILTRRQVRRGSYSSAAQLIKAIHDFIDAYNANPRPFAWTKTAEAIVAKAIPKDSSETEH